MIKLIAPLVLTGVFMWFVLYGPKEAKTSAKNACIKLLPVVLFAVLGAAMFVFVGRNFNIGF